MAEEAARRGRPRPEVNIKRDATIFTYLEENGAKSRNQIAEALGLSPSLTYLALSRLAGSGEVKRCLDSETGTSVWTARTEEPCP
jgi:DNA-binding MarR family transcriptional regulator